MGFFIEWYFFYLVLKYDEHENKKSLTTNNVNVSYRVNNSYYHGMWSVLADQNFFTPIYRLLHRILSELPTKKYIDERRVRVEVAHTPFASALRVRHSTTTTRVHGQCST